MDDLGKRCPLVGTFDQNKNVRLQGPLDQKYFP